MTEREQIPRLYDDLRETVKIPGTSVDKLRDLNYYGSDRPTRWKSGYKKDYPYYQPSDLIHPDPLGLRRPGEVLLRYENAPAPASETQIEFAKIPLEAPEREFRWSSTRGFNPNFFGGDDRLTNFGDTTSSHDFVKLPTKQREALDHVTRLKQMKHAPIGAPWIDTQYFVSKNTLDYPKHRNVEMAVPATAKPGQIKPCMKQLDGEGWNTFQSQTVSQTDFQPHSEVVYTNPGRKLVDSTYTDQFKVLAPRKSLFTEENQPRCPESNAQQSYKAFSMDEMKQALPEHRGHAPASCSNLFYTDPRVEWPKPQNQAVYDAHSSFNDTTDAIKRDRFGKRDYSDANGPLTVIWNNCRIEDNFMPKNLQQHSVMSESYPNYGNDAYHSPKETQFKPKRGNIPLGMEDGPPPDMKTMQQESYTAHPYVKEKSIRPSETGGMKTALPLNGSVFLAAFEEHESEFHSTYKKWHANDYAEKVVGRNLQVTTHKAEKDAVDFRTTNDIAYPKRPMVQTLPMDPQKDRNPILNNANGLDETSPFKPHDDREPYKPLPKNYLRKGML